LQCLLTPQLSAADIGNPARVGMAFALADRAMVELLRDRCVMTVELGDCTLFPASSTGDEVTCVADSAPEIVEAVEWLGWRGLAKIDRDEDGELITLLLVTSNEAEGPHAAH